MLVGHVGERFWYRTVSHGENAFAVPLIDMGNAGRGACWRSTGCFPADFDAGFDDEDESDGNDDGDGDGVRREGPKVFIVFEDPGRRALVASIWHCSGLAVAANAEVTRDS